MFKIGEKAMVLLRGSELIFGCDPALRAYQGRTVTIVSSPIFHADAGEDYFIVVAEDGRRFAAAVSVLHRIPPAPTREDLRVVSWGDCLWSPEGVNAA